MSDTGLSKMIFDKIGVPNFRKYLSLGSFRHKLISGNMANLSTPGYKAEDINFQDEFARLTKQTNHVAGALTNPNHIPLGQHENKPPHVEKAKIEDGDVNSVDIDQEASNLAQNELLYTIGAQLLQKKFQTLKTAITSK
ncbi:flagellar basal body rod protein FlgB [candidate division GN15 bacterium]|uniref:Flagellar basal body rod protein FlgB n=1 Tax=candidate division GN15 bacterium TaxID=2072418 RepID=A0A855X252_9BACT|nr:MAG: flagellar basal body rod protein FlgB [candidate division GN15 bacterium]